MSDREHGQRPARVRPRTYPADRRTPLRDGSAWRAGSYRTAPAITLDMKKVTLIPPLFDSNRPQTAIAKGSGRLSQLVQRQHGIAIPKFDIAQIRLLSFMKTRVAKNAHLHALDKHQQVCPGFITTLKSKETGA